MLSHSGDIPRSHSVWARAVLQNRQVGADITERYQAAPAQGRAAAACATQSVVSVVMRLTSEKRVDSMNSIKPSNICALLAKWR